MMRSTTPILSILIAILLFVFFTHPEYVEVKKIRDEISEYKNATAKYQDFTALLGEKLAMKEGRSAYEIERLDALVPAEIDETQYIVDLESIAERNNLLFSVSQVDEKALLLGRGEKSTPEAASDELSALDISFSVVGTYPQFKNFLRDLERSLTIFEVTHISFTVAEGPFQRFSVTVRTYALPESK